LKTSISSIKFLIVILIIPLVLLSACLRNNPDAQTEIQVAIALTQTSSAFGTQSVLGLSSTATTQPTETVLAATATEELPTETSPESPTATSTQPPVPTQPENCTNLAKMVSETIDDGTVFPASTKFTKKWVLRNDGTCNWLPDYEVIFMSGDQMGADSPIKIGKSVLPGESLELSVDFISPTVEGTYQGDWKLRTNDGVVFGLGKAANLTFWVKIKVDPTASSPDLSLDGDADWLDPMDNNDYAWYLGSDGVTNFAIADGVMTMQTERVTGEQWRIATSEELGNIYLEGTFITGENCSGKDGYGLLLRSPEASSPYYDSGYAFTVACDGTFRAFKMVEGNYQSIKDWTASSEILKGEKQTNQVGVLAIGSKFSIYVNRKLVYEFTDDKFNLGKFGVLIRSADHTNFSVSLDQLAYWNQ